MSTLTNIELRQCEQQVQFIQERVTRFEKQFGDLCTEFAGYTRRTAKLRDNGDAVARILHDYAQTEPHNKTMSAALKKFAEHISGAEDYRSVEAERLFAKVITPLSAYGDECKSIKTNIRACYNARKKEITQSKKVDRGNSNVSGSNDLTQARLEATRRQTNLENQSREFELKKLTGIKSILSDFVQIELLWHAKALEIYTQAFNDLQMMDSREDLDDFIVSLREGGSLLNSRLSLQQRSASHNTLHNTSTVDFNDRSNQGGTFPRSGGVKASTSGSLHRPPLPRSGSLPGVNTGAGGASTSTGIRATTAQPVASASISATRPKVTINGKPHTHDDNEDDDEYYDDDDEEGSFETDDDDEEDYSTSRTATTPRK